MPFDPKRFEEIKKQVAAKRAAVSVPSYDVEQAQSTAPTARLLSALDFSRRAMQPTEFKLTKDTLGSRFMEDLQDLTTGIGHLLGVSGVESYRLAKDIAEAAYKGTLRDTNLGKRVTSLPGQVGDILAAPGRKVLGDTIVKPAAQSFIDSFAHPVQSFKEHPLFTPMDWLFGVDIAGSGAKGALQIARPLAREAGMRGVERGIADILSRRRAPLPIAGEGAIGRSFSDNPIVKYVVQKPLDKLAARPGIKEFVSSVPIARELAPAELVTPEVRAGRMASDILTDVRQKFFNKRDKRLQEIQDKFASLPEEERKSFVAVVQGRALPLRQSPKWNEVYQWYKHNVLEEQAKFNLPDEVTKRVAYQPLAIATGKLSPDDYARALRGDESAMVKVKKVTDDVERTRVKVQEQALTEFFGKGSPKLAKELVRDVAPDPIYFPSVFEGKIKITDFLPSRFAQRFKPGFLKGRRGVSGYITDDPGKAMAIHDVMKERYLLNEDVVNSIQSKFAQPLNKVGDLKPGYVPFTPNGYISFYRTSMPLQEAFLKGVGMSQDVDTAFMNAVREIMPGLVKDRPIVGVSNPKIYQIPKTVAEKLHAIIQPVTPFGEAHEAVKLFWDTPLQAFKFSVLALSPRWVVNNTAGNMFLTAIGGVSPSSFAKTLQKGFKELIPEEVSSGGFRRAEIPGTKRVITPNTGLAEKVLGFATGETPTEGVLKNIQNVISPPARAIRKVADTIYDANTKVEDYFRNATYVDKAVKAAKEKIAKETSKGVFDMRTMLDKYMERGNFSSANLQNVIKEMTSDEKFRNSLINKVDDIMNNYQKMSNTERSIVRRIIPFWSWWKFMNKLFVKMPFEHPKITQIMRQLQGVGNEFSAQEWKESGLKLNEVPEWLRGAVRLGRNSDGIDLLGTRNINPLSTVGELPGLHPLFDILGERKTGRQSFTGMPFERPDVIDVGGRFFRLNEKGEPESISTPLPPPILTQALRRLPQLSALEALMTPYRIASGSPIFSGVPSLDSRGRPRMLHESLKLAQIMGLPIYDLSNRAIRGARHGARKAKRDLKTAVRRTGRRMEDLRLGKIED